jgi:hypothetical protein
MNVLLIQSGQVRRYDQLLRGLEEVHSRSPSALDTDLTRPAEETVEEPAHLRLDVADFTGGVQGLGKGTEAHKCHTPTSCLGF